MSAAANVRKLAMYIDRSRVLRRAANIWFLMVLLYIIVIPAGRNSVLLPALASIAGIGAIRMLVAWIVRSEPVRVRRLILIPALAGAVPVGLGALFDTQGWTDVAVPLLLAPILWFFASHAADNWASSRVLPVAAVATILLSIMIMMLVTGFGRSAVQVLHPKAGGSIGRGFSRVSVTGASSLISMVPLLGAAIFDSLRSDIRLRYPQLIWAGFLIGLIGAFLTGRQGVIGGLLIAPGVLIALSIVGFRLSRRVPLTGRVMAIACGSLVAVGIVGLGIVAALGVSTSRIPNDVIDAIGLGANSQNDQVRASSETRSRQVESFISGWKERPLTGHGGGAVSPDFYTWRGFEVGVEFIGTPRPWRAEMHYHLLLFESGLLGIAAYLGAIYVVLSQLLWRFRTLDDHQRLLVRAALVAAGAVVLATAYNPIVRAMAQQLPLYLPIIFVGMFATPATSRFEED